MGREQNARLAAAPADYERFGLDPYKVEPWEDGLRTDEGNETFNGLEWWYFQIVKGDDSLIVAFHTKPTREADGPLAPYASISVDGPSVGGHFERRIRVPSKEFSAAKADCDVRIGDYTVKRTGIFGMGTSGLYLLRVCDDDLDISLNLNSRMPPWRPETGHFTFGETNHFGWVVPMPYGTTCGKARIGGREIDFDDAVAYHDHNFGNVNPAEIISSWQWQHGWAREENWTRQRGPTSFHSPGAYIVLGAQLTAREHFGGNSVEAYMVGLEHYGPYVQGTEKAVQYPSGHDAAGTILQFDSDRHAFKAEFTGTKLIASRKRSVGAITIKPATSLPIYTRRIGNLELQHYRNDDEEGKFYNMPVAKAAGRCILESMNFV